MDLTKHIKLLIENKNINSLVNKRIREFKKKKTANELFIEICFCILTANFNAERALNIYEKLRADFLVLSQNKLAKKLKNLGHRFPNTRAKYIVNARKYLRKIKFIYKLDDKEAREWLVKNIKGLGYKEASHFLRNIGFKDVSILDFHILDLLSRFCIIQKPKYLSKKKYFEIEMKLRRISNKLGITLAELDLYLWYLETGKILK